LADWLYDGDDDADAEGQCRVGCLVSWVVGSKKDAQGFPLGAKVQSINLLPAAASDATQQSTCSTSFFSQDTAI